MRQTFTRRGMLAALPTLLVGCLGQRTVGNDSVHTSAHTQTRSGAGSAHGGVHTSVQTHAPVSAHGTTGTADDRTYVGPTYAFTVTGVDVTEAYTTTDGDTVGRPPADRTLCAVRLVVSNETDTWQHAPPLRGSTFSVDTDSGRHEWSGELPTRSGGSVAPGQLMWASDRVTLGPHHTRPRFDAYESRGAWFPALVPQGKTVETVVFDGSGPGIDATWAVDGGAA